jgi:hypothetical protein
VNVEERRMNESKERRERRGYRKKQVDGKRRRETMR